SPEISSFSNRTLEQIFALLAESQNFWEDVDDAKNWHKNELSKMTDKIQNKIHQLQNPPDCNEANLLICNPIKQCGFGCQLHQMAYCFILAATVNRTLVLFDDTNLWKYSSDTWDTVFKPIGKCNRSHFEVSEIVHWDGSDQKDRIIGLPIIDDLINKPEQVPLSFPKQIS
ncbi:hypothetical protein FO519_010973, partial [Halicephalobus sp. NKZ332]